MSEPKPLPEGQQPPVGEIAANQLNQLKHRETTYNQLEVDIARLNREHQQATRLRLLVSNEMRTYVNSLIREHIGENPEGHTYRVDIETGTIYQTGIGHTHDDEDQKAEFAADAAEAEAKAALEGNPTIAEMEQAEIPEPHPYKANRAPMQSDAQRCIDCNLHFDEIPGVHTDAEQPEPEE